METETFIVKPTNSTYDNSSKAESYIECFTDDFWKYVDDHTLQQLVGDVTDKSILEVGCGEGRVCRNIIKIGPLKRLVGTDISEPMIERARKISDAKIEFLVKDSTRPSIIDGGNDFDIAVSVYVFQYSSNYEELKGMISSAYVNLRKGGRFVGIFSAFSPAQPLKGYNRLFATHYEWINGEYAPFAGLDCIMNSTANDGINFKMFIHAIYPEIFEQAAQEVGFIKVNRKRYQVAPEARHSFDVNEVNNELSHIYVFELIK